MMTASQRRRGELCTGGGRGGIGGGGRKRDKEEEGRGTRRRKRSKRKIKQITFGLTGEGSDMKYNIYKIHKIEEEKEKEKILKEKEK